MIHSSKELFFCICRIFHQVAQDAFGFLTLACELLEFGLVQRASAVIIQLLNNAVDFRAFIRQTQIGETKFDLIAF